MDDTEYLFKAKKLRKDIRQGRLNSKEFYDFVYDYLFTQYNLARERVDPIIIRNFRIDLVNEGLQPDGSYSIMPALIIRGMKYLNEKDFLMFVRVFQLLFKHVGSLLVHGGREEVLKFAHDIQKKIGFKLIIRGDLSPLSTDIVATTEGKEIIIKPKQEKTGNSIFTSKMSPNEKIDLTDDNDESRVKKKLKFI
eukprot:SAG31_NODE_6892_length_1858_cov_4.003980_2_plen_194_part_00